MNYENIFVIMGDRDRYDPSLLPAFKALPYRKTLFSHENLLDDEVVYVEKDKNRPFVDGLAKYINWHGERTYEHYFDFERWLSDRYSTQERKRK